MNLTYLKDLLISKYQETIDFKDRTGINKSESVHDVRGGGDYSEAELPSLGISDKQLFKESILSTFLQDKKKRMPSTGHLVLTASKKLMKCVVQLSSWLKQP